MSVLEFDSEWFGKKIGRRDGDIEEADLWAKAAGLDCLYTLLPLSRIDEVYWATNHGFRLVDVKVEFVAEPRPYTLLRVPEPHEMKDVKRIASTSFVRTRFHNDRRFDRERVNAMYANWVDTSSGQVFVADGEGGIAGFVLVGDTHLELIAVDPAHRGQGHGLALAETASTFAAVNGQSEIRVITQGGNHAAQRTFQSVGFKLIETSLWLHKWYS